MSVNSEWQRTLRDLILLGNSTSPREMDTFEILNHSMVIPMTRPVLKIKERKLGYKFLHAEAAWICSGSNLVRELEPYSNEISRFSDDGIRFFGAYGPKVVDQLSYVTASLERDPYTRQAVMNIWRENPYRTKDVPCTISLQFLIRDKQLHCIANMRSSDIWLGVPYDIFNFSMIAWTVIIDLGHRTANDNHLIPGNLYLNAGSRHLYDINLQKAADIANGRCNACTVYTFADEYQPENFEDSSDMHVKLWDWAEQEYAYI